MAWVGAAMEPQNSPDSAASVNEALIADNQTNSDQIPNLQHVSQTMLKLTGQPELRQVLTIPETAPDVLERLHQLVSMIGQLQNMLANQLATQQCDVNTSGLPDLDPNPDSLAPYVEDEAYEVLAALERHADRAEKTLPGAKNHVLQRYVAIDSLVPRLLWYIARSHYDVMQLLGGIETRILDPDGEWRSGILRLAAILDAEIADDHWQLDLATLQPPQPALDDAILIEEPHIPHQEPLSTAAWLARIRDRLQTETPEIRLFLEQISVEVLKPGHDWQSGLIKLQLALVFTNPEPPTTLNRAPVPAVASAPEPAPETTPEAASESTVESAQESLPELMAELTPDLTSEPTAEPIPEITVDSTSEPTLESVPEPTAEVEPEPSAEPAPDFALAHSLERTCDPTPKSVPAPTAEAAEIAGSDPEPAIEVITELTAEAASELLLRGSDGDSLEDEAGDRADDLDSELVLEPSQDSPVETLDSWVQLAVFSNEATEPISEEPLQEEPLQEEPIQMDEGLLVGIVPSHLDTIEYDAGGTLMEFVSDLESLSIEALSDVDSQSEAIADDSPSPPQSDDRADEGLANTDLAGAELAEELASTLMPPAITLDVSTPDVITLDMFRAELPIPAAPSLTIATDIPTDLTLEAFEDELTDVADILMPGLFMETTLPPISESALYAAVTDEPPTLAIFEQELSDAVESVLKGSPDAAMSLAEFAELVVEAHTPQPKPDDAQPETIADPSPKLTDEQEFIKILAADVHNRPVVPDIRIVIDPYRTIYTQNYAPDNASEETLEDIQRSNAFADPPVVPKAVVPESDGSGVDPEPIVSGSDASEPIASDFEDSEVESEPIVSEVESEPITVDAGVAETEAEVESESVTAEASVANTEVVQTEIQPDKMHADVSSESEAMQAEECQPEAIQAETSQPEAQQPDAIQAGVQSEVISEWNAGQSSGQDDQELAEMVCNPEVVQYDAGQSDSDSTVEDAATIAPIDAAMEVAMLVSGSIPVQPQPVAAPALPKLVIEMVSTIAPDDRSNAMLYQKLLTSLPALQPVYPVAKPGVGEFGRSAQQQNLATLVAMAWQILDQVNQDSAQDTFPYCQATLPLDEWMSRLLWQITSHSYDITQLVGGVAASALEPDVGWIAGRLRLLATLTIATADYDWSLDLSTGCQQSVVGLLAPGVLVQSEVSDVLHEPQRVEQLIAVMTEQLHIRSPFLQLLATGANVNVFTQGVTSGLTDSWDPDSDPGLDHGLEHGETEDATAIATPKTGFDWQPGTMRLDLALELVRAGS